MPPTETSHTDRDSRDGHIKNLVNNVPNWNAVRFATEAEAHHYYQLQETAGNTLAVSM